MKIVEVAPEEDLDSFSRLGLGFGVASKFMKETADMAKAEISEFQVQYKQTNFEKLTVYTVQVYICSHLCNSNQNYYIKCTI